MKRIETKLSKYQGWSKLAALLVSAAALSAACQSAPADRDTEAGAAPVEQIRPGAQKWHADALALPANSPVVFWVSTNAVLERAEALRDWLLLRPEMYGADGEQMVDSLKRGWQGLVREFGMDPLAPQSWAQIGIDPTRDIYVGAYPAEVDANQRFVETFEQALRAQLELGPDADLRQALAAMRLFDRRELPSGIYAAVSQASQQTAPTLGVRVVVPVTAADTFAGSVDALMSGAGYGREQLDDADDRQRYYFHARSNWPGVMLRVSDNAATFDLLSRSGPRGLGETSQSDADALRERLNAAIDQIDPGRPGAPRPPGRPLFGVAADGLGAAGVAKLRGYAAALRAAHAVDVDQRDAVFLQQLHAALSSAGNWTVADGELTGVSYGLFSDAADGEADPASFFRLNVTLFGAASDPALAVSPVSVALGVRTRGLGLSVDLAAMTDEPWQRWVGVAGPETLVEHFSAADFDPGLFALSFPRSLALLFANAEKILHNRLPDSLEALFARRDLFERLEVASAGIDMRSLRMTPRFVGLLAIDAESTPEQRQELAGQLGAALDQLGAHNAAAEAADDAEPAGQVQPLQVDTLVDVPREPAFYYFAAAHDPPYLFVSYGLDREASLEEFKALTDASAPDEATRRTFYGRAEPVALLSLVTIFEPDLFEPLDISVLAQRIGALVFTVAPEVIDGVQTIRYDFELLRPPEL